MNPNRKFSYLECFSFLPVISNRSQKQARVVRSQLSLPLNTGTGNTKMSPPLPFH